MVSKTRHKIDLTKIKGFDDLKRNVKARLKEEVGNFVKESVLDHVGDGKSPVANGAWKRSLSPEYRKIKAKTSGVTFANLELEGDMLDTLDFKKTSTGVEVGIYGDSLQDKKAFNHNTGDTLPQRQFIPIGNGNFKKPIESEIRKIVREAHANKENLKKQKKSLAELAAIAAAARRQDGEG